MIGKKIGALTLTATMLLTACGQSTDSLESFYKKIEKANKKEKVIVDLNEEMTKAEKEKVAKIEKLNKAKGDEFKSIAEEITKSVDDREAIIDKEDKAMKDSKEIFETSEKDYKAIEDDEQIKEAKDFKNILDKKYKTHEEVIKGYKGVLKAEKELFGYLSKDKATQQGADECSEKLTEENKKTEKVVTDYQNQLKKVQQEKQDVAQILNN